MHGCLCLRLPHDVAMQETSETYTLITTCKLGGLIIPDRCTAQVLSNLLEAWAAKVSDGLLHSSPSAGRGRGQAFTSPMARYVYHGK